MSTMATSNPQMTALNRSLAEADPEIFQAINQEKERQVAKIELIASENYTSQAVIEAMGSVLTNKYAEGYPGHRYYGGCEYVDIIEDLARERLKKLFGAGYANVQPHSGAQANTAVYLGLLQPGDKVLGMNLSQGGHLTHGSPVNFSGKLYQISAYGVDKDTGLIDYDEVARIADMEQPKMIIAGASAYARVIDFARFRAIADEVGAYLMVDMAHIAGLVAAGLHPSPVPHAHVTTSTTHKTLRGPRGGFILTNDEALSKLMDKAVFPGVQGGPLMHVIAAKAVSFAEALRPEFTVYQQNVLNNARTLAATLSELGFTLVSGGTDNHLVLVDVKSSVGLTGKKAEKALDDIGITVNKNAIPYDTEKPNFASGIRVGTPAVTTRGFGTAEMIQIGNLINKALRNFENEEVYGQLREEVAALTSRFPVPAINI